MAKATPPTDQDGAAEIEARKGRPTPTRREQEAARKRPLVPSDRRVAAKQSKEQIAAQRDRQRAGMAAGDDRYLPARDKGPQKRYVRDFVDARFSVGEILLPLLVVVILSYFFPTIASYALIAVWGVIVIVLVDGFIMGQMVTRRLAAKFGEGKVERGVRWYAFMRAIQLRPMRLPKPQVKRGQYPR